MESMPEIPQEVTAARALSELETEEIMETTTVTTFDQPISTTEMDLLSASATQPQVETSDVHVGFESAPSEILHETQPEIVDTTLVQAKEEATDEVTETAVSREQEVVYDVTGTKVSAPEQPEKVVLVETTTVTEVVSVEDTGVTEKVVEEVSQEKTVEDQYKFAADEGYEIVDVDLVCVEMVLGETRN